jgi:hypothetical protein
LAVLPKLHVNRNTARSIVFVPTSHGGLGLPTVYSEQSFGQLAYFTGYINLEDKTGRLLLISLSYLQLLSGSKRPILNQMYSDYGAWIEHSWIMSLWEFLSRVQYKMHITTQWLPIKPRKNDFSLMDHFLRLAYSPAQLGTLNRCRLYLHIIYLSDIVSADGTIIIPDCKEGRRLTDKTSTLNWQFRQPPRAAWTLWHQALGHFETYNRLLIPLRHWANTTHQRWKWYAEIGTSTVFHEVTPGDWKEDKPLQQHNSQRSTRQTTRHQYDIRRPTQSTRIPQNLVPVTLIETAERNKYNCLAVPPLSNLREQPIPTSFESTLYTQPVAGILEAISKQISGYKTVHIGVCTRQVDQLYAYKWSIFTTTKCTSDAGVIDGRFQMDNGTSLLAGLLAVTNLLYSPPDYLRQFILDYR